VQGRLDTIRKIDKLLSKLYNLIAEIANITENGKIMKRLLEIKKILEEHRDKLRREYKIKNIKVFGSYVEGKETKKSDIDLIVEFESTPTLIELVRIEEELSQLLHVKVDLLTEEGISPYVKPYIKEFSVL